ncbi:MAG: hypothetical protein ACFB00_13705 [Parvularculaceae bacterium]
MAKALSTWDLNGGGPRGRRTRHAPRRGGRDARLAASVGYEKPAALSAGYNVRGDAYGGGLGRGARRLSSPLSFLRCTAQGACAGLLGVIGGMHLTGALPEQLRSIESIAALDVGGFGALGGSVLGAGLPGVIELVGAAALFLSAGRGLGRILGLMGFAAFIALQAQGVETGDIAERVRELAEVALGAAQRLIGPHAL